MRKSLVTTASLLALAALSGAAFAQSNATAFADLNIRTGPGPMYEITGYVPVDGAVQVEGCIEGSMWCRVSYNGVDGWVYSEYLVADYDGSRVIVSERRSDIGVPAMAPPETVSGGAAAGSTMGAVGGAVAGALVGGPIGAVIGGVAGAAAGGVTGSVIDPPSQVRTYVMDNRHDPVYLEGEVVVGAGVPETVELREVPEYEYRYVYVNGQPVLVEPETRRIVYIVR